MIESQRVKSLLAAAIATPCTPRSATVTNKKHSAMCKKIEPMLKTIGAKVIL